MKKGEIGQVLIEALVALGAAVAIVGAITTIVVTSLNNAELAKNQNQATQYAQQGMEAVRELSETDWSDFIGHNVIYYCLGQGSSNLLQASDESPNACKWENDIFTRQITINHSSPDCQGDPSAPVTGSQVIVTVSWSDSKCTDHNNLYCHKVALTSCFSNINAEPTI